MVRPRNCGRPIHNLKDYRVASWVDNSRENPEARLLMSVLYRAIVDCSLQEKQFRRIKEEAYRWVMEDTVVIKRYTKVTISAPVITCSHLCSLVDIDYGVIRTLATKIFEGSVRITPINNH